MDMGAKQVYQIRPVETGVHVGRISMLALRLWVATGLPTAVVWMEERRLTLDYGC